MKINSALLLLASIVLLSGSAPAQTPADLPAQSPMPTAPAAPIARPVAPDWRDAPQTPGAWTYAAEPGGSAARFGLPGALPLVVLRCDRVRPAVLIQRQSLGSGALPATITTSSSARRLVAAPARGSPMAQNGAILFEIALNTADPLLDAMAFSRGRFLFEMSGAATLVLPAWAEVGRVIEDCR
jgi:hypothetical protein